MQFMKLFCDWLTILRPGRRLVALQRSQFSQPYIISIQNTFGLIDAILKVNLSSGQIDVRFRAIRSRGQECQTHHCQHQSSNIGDKFQTEQLRMKDKGQVDCCPTESQNHCYVLNEI